MYYECSIKHYSSILAFHSGFVPAFIKLYTTLFIGIKISDIAVRNVVEESQLWEPATVYSPTQPGYIPHEDKSRFAYGDEYLAPSKEISLGPGSKSVIRF
jgi:hypothetical protein